MTIRLVSSRACSAILGFGGFACGAILGALPFGCNGDSALSGMDGMESSSGGNDTDTGRASEDENVDGNDDSSVVPDGVAISFDGTPTYSRFVRLTHAQWEASVRDVLRLDDLPGLAEGFIGDPNVGRFANNERGLEVTSNLWGDYQRAAEEIAARVAADATARGRLMSLPGDPTTFVTDLGRRVYRRPLTAVEIQRYVGIFESGTTLLASGDPTADGIHMVLEAMLQSPYFLYRTELGDDGLPLSGYEVASKLSFTLLNTTPSDALLDAAAAGDFDTSAGVLAHAREMLESPVGVAAFEQMQIELLGTDRYRSITKDVQRFPIYTENLNGALQEADRLFFDYLYSNNLGLRDLLLSRVAFVDPATAPLYGLTVEGPAFQQVELDATRPGFFTRAGFLALNGTLVDPDPIHRGVDMNRELLCTAFPPPPGEIPPLPATEPGQTNRQRVDAHTGIGTCGAGCHSEIINPLGFAFENFDTIGMLRTTDNGLPIDTSGAYRLPDGLHPFANATELLQIIAESPQAHACFAKHVAEFTLARDLTALDGAEVFDVMEVSLEPASSLKELVLYVVQSPSFLIRNGGPQ